MSMLASDLNNPEFVGAQDPNKLLYVEFYMHEPEDGNKPWVNGKPVRMPAIPYVKIMVPGNKNSEVDTPVRDDHKQRFPEKWMYFLQTQQQESGVDIPGWKVDDWDQLTPSEVRDLKYLRFYTVEQIAGASDAQVQKLGMGGLGLRERARQAIKQKLGADESSALAAKDAEIAEMKAAMARMEAAVAALQNPVPVALPAEQPAPEALVETVKDTSERDALVAQFVAKHGKKPHHKLGLDKIRAALG